MDALIEEAKKGRLLLGGLLAAIPWAVWYGLLLFYQRSVRLAKNVSDYDGVCVKPNGYRLKCSLDRWMDWDPNAGLAGTLTFCGMLLAAAASAWLFLRIVPCAPLADLVTRLSSREKTK